MSTPTTAAAPDRPTVSSPLRPGSSFVEWFQNIVDFLKGYTPAGTTVFDTGWQAITTNAGYTGSESVAWRRIGKEIKLRGLITRDAGVFPAAHEAAFTLPAGARPPGYYRWPVATYSSANTRGAMATIGTDGICYIGSTGDGSDVVRLSAITFWVD